MISPSHFQFTTKIPISTLQQIANKMLAGKPLPVEQIKLIPNNIRITGEGERLVIKADLSGTFNGGTTIKTTPVYNRLQGNVDFNKVDLRLDGKDLKSKGIALVASRIIEDQINKHVNIPLKTIVENTNRDIRQNEIMPDILLEANIANYDLAEFKINDQMIDIQLIAEGIFSFTVKDEQSI